MNSLNKAQIIGNITKDPELRQTQSGQQVCTFSIATNYSWKDSNGNKQEEAEFHNIVAWGKLAEICSQYLRKGQKVFVEGRLKTQSWEDKESGKKMYRTEIICKDMIMLSKKDDGGHQAPPPSDDDFLS